MVSHAGERHVHRERPDRDLAGAQAADDAGSLYTEDLITEKYTSAGQPKENSVSSTVQVHYNDSPKEIMAISMRFITELFPTSTIPAQQAVADFSDSCSEKASEFNDVANNRINFQILSGTYTNVSVTPNGDRTFADVSGTCVFKDIPKDPKNPNVGKAETVTGICRLTAIYENWKWWLCSSRFEGIGVTTSSSSLPRPRTHRLRIGMAVAIGALALVAFAQRRRARLSRWMPRRFTWMGTRSSSLASACSTRWARPPRAIRIWMP